MGSKEAKRQGSCPAPAINTHRDIILMRRYRSRFSGSDSFFRQRRTATCVLDARAARKGARCLTAIVLLSLLLSSRVFAETASPATDYRGTRDFAAYWAAARLLASGENPYSAASLLSLQRSIGLTEPEPLIMWNPPWTLAFVLPFGWIEFSTAQFLWLLLQSLFLAFSAHQLWRIYSKSSVHTWMPWILAFTFIPAVYALVLGQITPTILFGITSFMLAERRRKWWGLSPILVLLAIKPHFIYLFWVVAALWIWQQRLWQIALGAVLLGLVAGAIPLFLDPAIYSRYLAVLQSPDYRTPLDLPAPTLRNALIVFLHTDSLLLQFLPTFGGLAWVLWYWRSRKSAWVWAEHLPLILLVSLTVTPYAWTFDQTVLLTAIIQAFAWLRERATWFMVAHIFFNAAYLAMRYWMPLDLWYFWTAPLLLAVYLMLRRWAIRSPGRSSARHGAWRDDDPPAR